MKTLFGHPGPVAVLKGPPVLGFQCPWLSLKALLSRFLRSEHFHLTWENSGVFITVVASLFAFFFFMWSGLVVQVAPEVPKAALRINLRVCVAPALSVSLWPVLFKTSSTPPTPTTVLFAWMEWWRAESFLLLFLSQTEAKPNCVTVFKTISLQTNTHLAHPCGHCIQIPVFC